MVGNYNCFAPKMNLAKIVKEQREWLNNCAYNINPFLTTPIKLKHTLATAIFAHNPLWLWWK